MAVHVARQLAEGGPAQAGAAAADRGDPAVPPFSHLAATSPPAPELGTDGKRPGWRNLDQTGARPGAGRSGRRRAAEAGDAPPPSRPFAGIGDPRLLAGGVHRIAGALAHAAILERAYRAGRRPPSR